jgi:hypothetical protein
MVTWYNMNAKLVKKFICIPSAEHIIFMKKLSIGEELVVLCPIL